MSMKRSQTRGTLLLLLLLNTNILTLFQDHYSDKIMELTKDGPSLSHMITTSPEKNEELNHIYIQFYLRIFRETSNLNKKPVIYLQYDQTRAFALSVDFSSGKTSVDFLDPGNSLRPSEMVHKGYESYKDWCYFRFKVTRDLMSNTLSLQLFANPTLIIKNYYPISKINFIKLIFCTDSWESQSFCTQYVLFMLIKYNIQTFSIICLKPGLNSLY